VVYTMGLVTPPHATLSASAQGTRQVPMRSIVRPRSRPGAQWQSLAYNQHSAIVHRDVSVHSHAIDHAKSTEPPPITFKGAGIQRRGADGRQQ
jgi:hypothetical protein